MHVYCNQSWVDFNSAHWKYDHIEHSCLWNRNRIYADSNHGDFYRKFHFEKNKALVKTYITCSNNSKIYRMNKRGPIVIIEDDIDDQDILTDIFKELNYNNKLIFFADGEKALEYLTETDIEPFLVLSDLNMPKLNGMELREKIHNNEDLRLKSIPYLFFSTSAEQRHVIDAYSRSIQGFFVKPSNYDKLKKIIVKIVEYWQECESPNYIKNAQQ